jgi:sigma-B regulation protein RsbU (phosphoserine phosphatase)
VGLDNVYLHTQLLEQQAVLEDTVLARTRELAAANRDLLATQAQLEEELRVAGTLQQSILPASFPFHLRYAGASAMRPARSIGGDFYDIFRFDERRIGVVVADVSGKGAPAALFMVLVRTILQDVAYLPLSPAEAIAEVNRRLLERNPLSLFVTVMYGVLDAETGCFLFCSGGHGMPYVRRADGDANRVCGRPSPLVGLLETARFTDQRIDLAPGDMVVLTTDGVEEACSAQGEMYGSTRLRAALMAESAATPTGLLETVLADVDRFTDGTPASDDLTCLVTRWTGSLATVESATAPGA